MSKVVAICNQKGGVGKTTTTVNLGAALALLGQRVLLIDLDPQANATSGLGIEKSGVDRSIYQILFDDCSVESAIRQTKVKNLSLIPSQSALSGAEVELVGIESREQKLKGVLDPIRTSYDIILMDCPPSLGLLTVNALTAATSVLIPLQCEYYALEGLTQLLETIRLVQAHLNPRLSVEGVLLTMADFRTKLTNDVISEVRQFFGPKVYDLVIPRTVRLSEAPSHGLPINLYDPDSTGTRAYQLLAEQMMGRKESEEDHDVRNTGIGTRDKGTHSGEAGGAGSGGTLGESSTTKLRSGESGGGNSSTAKVDTTKPLTTP